MKNLYDNDPTEEILSRIDKLSQYSQPHWGAMNVAQMLAHCAAFQDIAMGNSNPGRGWLGLLVGRFAKPGFYNDTPLPRNMSTIPSILISNTRDFENESRKLKQQIITFQNDGPEACTTHPHPFFGRLSPEQWGKGLYKHYDHHLRQFGV